MAKIYSLTLLFVGLCAGMAAACSICGGGIANRSTLRQEALQATHVYVGTLSNPRLNSVNAAGAANASATDFTVNQVIKSDAARKAQKQITIPRYVPVDPKAPPQYLVFCGEENGRLDPYRGTPVTSPAVVEYLRGALAIDSTASDKLLAFAGKYLDNADADVAAEAFLEFAKANDAEVLKAAKTLAPATIRKLLSDPTTPTERLGLYVYLLGASGTAEDAAQLKRLLEQPGERFRGSLSGLYAGLIMLQPVEGWKTLLDTLQDARRPYPEKLAALSALRFFYNANPKDSRPRAMTGLKALLPQEDIADYAIEDLRKWEIWDTASEVFALFGKKSHDSPLMQRAILRYALCCPNAEAPPFLAEVRIRKPDLVKDVEESLQYERSLAKPQTATNP